MQGWALQMFTTHMHRVPTERERVEIERAVKMGATRQHILSALHSLRPPPKGLKNLGNTCYMNSALQMLMTCPEFLKNSRFRHFVQAMDPEIPRNWVARRYSQFRNWAQHDSHEWLLALLDVCNTKLFEGEMEVHVTFLSCKHTNTHKEPFVTVSLPMVGDSMETAMEHFFQTPEEVVSTCDTCNDNVKKKATKSLTISTLPTYFIVHWKRFDKAGNKIKKRMQTPFFMFGKRMAGTVNHTGSMFSGHYTACACHNDHWHYISDAEKMGIEERHAIKSSELAYMLVYR